VGEAVHEHDCKFIMQLSHSGRQRDLGGVEAQDPDKIAFSSTDEPDPFHGIQCKAMTKGEIDMVVDQFAQGARRAKEAGLDGIELHGANGYLITQFLSSGINDRTDDYGGSVENRARFVNEIIHAIRKEVGDDFHLQMKINAMDYDNVINPFAKKGNTLEETIEICKILEQGMKGQAGADAFVVSNGSLFPHPLNPPGDLPLEFAVETYGAMMVSGNKTLRNYLFFKWPILRPIFLWLWGLHKKGKPVEGVGLEGARLIKQAVNVPVLSTGGYQNRPFLDKHLKQGDVDGFTIARSLIANRDLISYFSDNKTPPKPCTYCNKCLVYAPGIPLACWEQDRFKNYDDMVETAYKVYK
jgi:2,4-dienoyl-CoA reductase (NADPH2)